MLERGYPKEIKDWTHHEQHNRRNSNQCYNKKQSESYKKAQTLT